MLGSKTASMTSDIRDYWCFEEIAKKERKSEYRRYSLYGKDVFMVASGRKTHVPCPIEIFSIEKKKRLLTIMEAAMNDALLFLANLAREVNPKPRMVSNVACDGLVPAAKS